MMASNGTVPDTNTDRASLATFAAIETTLK